MDSTQAMPGTAGQPVTERSGLGWQGDRLLCWLLALAGPGSQDTVPDLPDSERQRLERDCAAEIEQMTLLQDATRCISRSRLAELLRARVSGMALAAQTPAELAAVARTVKTLPDWVWDDAVVEADRAQPAKGGMPRVGQTPTEERFRRGVARTFGEGESAEWRYVDFREVCDPQSPPLNRAQRRAIESRLRKGK